MKLFVNAYTARAEIGDLRVNYSFGKYQIYQWGQTFDKGLGWIPIHNPHKTKEAALKQANEIIKASEA